MRSHSRVKRLATVIPAARVTADQYVAVLVCATEEQLARVMYEFPRFEDFVTAWRAHEKIWGPTEAHIPVEFWTTAQAAWNRVVVHRKKK